MLSWLFTNLYVHIIHVFGKQSAIARISYEQLTSDPKTALSTLQNEIGIDVSEVQVKIDQSIAFPAGHIFSGDLQRMNGDYQISSQAIKWPKRLNKLQRCMVWITYPLARRYGFLKFKM